MWIGDTMVLRMTARCLGCGCRRCVRVCVCVSWSFVHDGVERTARGRRETGYGFTYGWMVSVCEASTWRPPRFCYEVD